MKVKFLVAVNNGHYTIPVGATADVPEPEAIALIADGKAIADEPYAMCMQDNSGYHGCLSPQQLEGNNKKGKTGTENPE